MYRHLSRVFFSSARTSFQKWSANGEFQTLDLEQHPFSQGFEGESYDPVIAIAANVLHATHRIDTTLAHVQKPLRQSKRLPTFEIARARPSWNTLFGLRSVGFNEGRRDKPLLISARWDGAFLLGSFTGVEFRCERFRFI